MVRLFSRKKEKVEEGVNKTRQSWFSRAIGLLSRSKVDDATWDELEEVLISADVGAELAMRLIETVKQRSRKERADDGPAVNAILQDEMARILERNASKSPLTREGQSFAFPVKPYVILTVGVNGAGKTTTIAKLAHMLTQDHKRVLLAAGDTFRAAAVEQLVVWGGRANAEVISHSQGADPGAVAFDALQAAKARGADVLIIDTAGRLHTKTNLMEELKKVHRVIQRFDPTSPHETILVLDATTGQNGVAQAKNFMDAVGVTGLMLAKLDGTARGGVVLSIADQLGVPLLFIGTGEQIDDIAPFDARGFVEALFSKEA